MDTCASALEPLRCGEWWGGLGVGFEAPGDHLPLVPPGAGVPEQRCRRVCLCASLYVSLLHRLVLHARVWKRERLASVRMVTSGRILVRQPSVGKQVCENSCLILTAIALKVHSILKPNEECRALSKFVKKKKKKNIKTMTTSWYHHTPKLSFHGE